MRTAIVRLKTQFKIYTWFRFEKEISQLININVLTSTGKLRITGNSVNPDFSAIESLQIKLLRHMVTIYIFVAKQRANQKGQHQA